MSLTTTITTASTSSSIIINSAPYETSTSSSNRSKPHPLTTTGGTRTRSSSLLHKTVISRMRPLPFQYVFSMWHTRASSSSQPTQLAESIPDIAAFYRAFNNFPWADLHAKDGVHFFRTGVRPLWEDSSNAAGGCWVLKVRKEDARALRTWEELCLLVCGGELQAAVARERDHILGISYSPRLYHAHISIWTMRGDNQNSIRALQKVAVSRLSESLRPTSEMDYYYKKHSEHEGWQEAMRPGNATTVR